MDVTLFAAGLATLYAAHQVADHVFGQTDEVANNKVKPGKAGWSAIVQHVLSYHLVVYFMLMITVVVLNVPVSLLGFFLCLAFSTASHAIIDRRWPVQFILEKTGSPKFAQMTTPLNGMYLADQGLHYLCLWISALLLTVG